MAYFMIALLILVVMAGVLLLPGIQLALPVLVGIFPLAILNIAAGWMIFYHFQQQGRRI